MTIEEKHTLVYNVINLIDNELLSTRKALKQLGYSSDTFYRIIDEFPELSKRYARACEDRADALADEILEIADDSQNDTKYRVGKDGIETEVENTEWVNRSKLRVDSRKWLLAKLHPKKYGDSQRIDHTTNGKEIKLPDWMNEGKP